MVSRPATRDDIDEVVRLAGVMFESMGLDATDPGWRREGAAAVGDRLGHDLNVFVVDHPTEQGRLVASGAGIILRRLPTPMGPDGRVGHIQWVAADPEFRRRGYGRAVMEALLGWYRAQQITHVELHATPEGEPLYRSLGFGESRNPHLRWQP
jgi:ribosomal protein S18 acetylase RimI-like enzyme